MGLVDDSVLTHSEAKARLEAVWPGGMLACYSDNPAERVSLLTVESALAVLFPTMPMPKTSPATETEMRIINDRDCPGCDWPEIVKVGLPSVGPNRAECGRRQPCGWTAAVVNGVIHANA